MPALPPPLLPFNHSWDDGGEISWLGPHFSSVLANLRIRTWDMGQPLQKILLYCFNVPGSIFPKQNVLTLILIFQVLSIYITVYFNFTVPYPYNKLISSLSLHTYVLVHFYSHLLFTDVCFLYCLGGWRKGSFFLHFFLNIQNFTCMLSICQ